MNRDEVYGAEETLGLPLDEFIATAIAGIQQVAPEIGLQGLTRQSGRPVKCSDPTAGGGRQPPSQE